MHEFTYLHSVLILLSVSIIILVFMNKLKLSPVLGYLIAGAFIGEHGLNLIDDYAITETLGEFGVVFLLFAIGLEMTFERLIKMRWHVFGFGGLQIIITTYLFTKLMRGVFGLSTEVSIAIAAALSLSSTAIVMQVLEEHKRANTQVGRLSFATLLMQDFAVVPLLTILPILAKGGEHIATAVFWASSKAIISIFLMTIIGRIFLRPFFSIIASAKDEQIYVTTALLIVLGASWITNNLGLSAAMGAFLAGLLIAETEYRNKIEDSIAPFQGLFLALFFISVGMSVDIRFIMQHFYKVFILAVVFILIKALVIISLSKIFRFAWGAAIHTGLLLSQVSEFAFILLGLADKLNIINNNVAQLLLVVTAITMAITPLLAIIGTKIEDKLGLKQELDDNNEFHGVSDLNKHVVIAGFGRVGRTVAYMLAQEQRNYVAIDSNAVLVKKSQFQGFPIFHGSIADKSTLEALGLTRALALVLSMNDKGSVSKATRIIRQLYPGLPIIVRVEDYKHSVRIKKLGATTTVPTTIETGLQLGSTVLRSLGIPEHEISSLKDKTRKNDYIIIEDLKLFRGVLESEGKI